MTANNGREACRGLEEGDSLSFLLREIVILAKQQWQYRRWGKTRLCDTSQIGQVQ
jgi:hypothetical protein